MHVCKGKSKEKVAFSFTINVFLEVKINAESGLTYRLYVKINSGGGKYDFGIIGGGIIDRRRTW